MGGRGPAAGAGASVVVEAFRRGCAVVSSRVPRRVWAEGERFLECGDVRHGFVEVACGACRESRLVAFLCKGAGPRPVVHWVEGVMQQGEPPKDAVEAWARTTKELLDGLLRKRGHQPVTRKQQIAVAVPR